MIEAHESTTAKLCSFARAYHSTYARKKIFDDSPAFDFMGLEQYEETGQLIGHNYQENLIDPNLSFHSSDIVDKLNRYLMPIPISRIAFAEQELISFASRFPRCQYVICGAGTVNRSASHKTGKMSLRIWKFNSAFWAEGVYALRRKEVGRNAPGLLAWRKGETAEISSTCGRWPLRSPDRRDSKRWSSGAAGWSPRSGGRS